MKITSSDLNASNLTANERALLCCQIALEFRDKGDYHSARNAMRPLWVRVGDKPNIKGLHASVAAEVFLCVGVLTSWIGSKEGLEQAQEIAKNLITEGIRFYESTGDVKKVAAARAEIAYCYFREGAFGEARIMLTEALEKLTTEGNTRARALLKLATVEWAASRSHVALDILTANAPLFQKIRDNIIRANYHNELAIVLRHIANSDAAARDALLKQAISEFEQADKYLQLSKNKIFRASVKNNVGLILFNLTKYKEAHKNLEQARRLAASIKDRVLTAQIDDTRAQVYIAEKKFKEAENIARNAVRILAKSGHQCLLADALITQGIALARLKQVDHAQFIFQKAIEVAHQVGALNKAGLAALTMIEELEELPSDQLSAAYDRASEWLEKSQSQEILSRLSAVARKVFSRLRIEATKQPVVVEDPIEALFNKPCDLQVEVLKFEGSVIQRALQKANGSLTRAASMLSTSYQALAYILESRQQELLKERTPIRRRTRKDRPPPETT